MLRSRFTHILSSLQDLQNKPDVAPELDGIQDDLDGEIQKIHEEMSQRGILRSGITVAEKGKKVPRYLSERLDLVVMDYHSNDDVGKIITFIDTIHESVAASFKNSGFQNSTYDKFDTRMNNLKLRYGNKALHIRKQKLVNRIVKIVGILIATVGVAVPIIIFWLS